MSRSLRTALLPFTLLPLLGATAPATRPLTVRVGVINRSDTNARLVRAGTHRAREIFRQAGIELSFVMVDPLAFTGDGAERTAFRIVFSDETSHARHVLGAADIRTQTAWVLIPNARETARETRTSEAVVVAHVLAHELGHLLLRSPAHAVSGLMADPLDFNLAEQGGLRFHGEQIRGMQRRLVTHEQ